MIGDRRKADAVDESGVSMHSASYSRSVENVNSQKLILSQGESLHAPCMRNGGTISQLEDIGRRISAARDALDLSQVEVCRNIGVGETTWNNWEHGKRKPDPIAMVRFANAYGVTLDWIYRGDLAGLPGRILTRIIQRDAS